MVTMGKTDKILQALATMPDQILEHYLPDFPPAVVRQTLLDACKTKPAAVAKPRKKPPTATASSTGMTHLVMYTDGASRGNPGQAGAGAVILDDEGQELLTVAEYLGTCTNNVAEYQALILGLTEAVALGGKNISIFLDSQLIVRQVQGIYKVKNQTLQPLFAQVKKLLAQFDSYKIAHIARELNKRADELANRGIDDR